MIYMSTLDRAISMCDSSYEIKNVRGHYEVYKNGKFFCSADTRKEASEEIKKDEKKVRPFFVSYLPTGDYSCDRKYIEVMAANEKEARELARKKLGKNARDIQCL